jgi:hypothetical protein
LEGLGRPIRVISTSYSELEAKMATTTKSQGLLRSYVGKIQDCSLVEGPNAIEFLIRRIGLTIRITLPNEVQEWFVDVEDPSTGLKSHDWYDYSGYESRTSEELDRDMAQDLKSFVENLSTNPLRMRIADRRRGEGMLEWEVGGTWKGAVPADGRT